MKEYLWGKTYSLNEELVQLQEILSAALEHGRWQENYLIPYSYWTDYHGWLYVKWNLVGPNQKPVVRYRFGNHHELVVEIGI